jgi:hypothetical protein
MIRFQIVEHHGAGLHRKLLDYMRSGELQTFSSSKRGRKISHVKYRPTILPVPSPQICQNINSSMPQM